MTAADRIKVGECEACGFAGNTLRIESGQRGRGPWQLCEVCVATPTGLVVKSPAAVSEEVYTLRAIAHGVNLILRELRRPAR